MSPDDPPANPGWVLASSSRYRAEVLRAAGIQFEAIAPNFDERSLDGDFETWGPDRYVIEVARGKAASVAATVPPGTIVVAADQIAVADGRLLTKAGSEERAIDQLVALSGRTHLLLNGIVVRCAPEGPEATALDAHRVTMAAFDRAAARSYVERFLPLDCVGAYRIEDDAGLIASVEGSGDDGVIGLPIALTLSLIERVKAAVPQR